MIPKNTRPPTNDINKLNDVLTCPPGLIKINAVATAPTKYIYP